MSPWSWVTQYREAWHDQKGLLKGTGYGSEEHPSFGRPHIFNLLKAWVPRDRSGGRDRSGAGSGLHALEPGSLNDSKEALTALHLVAGDACLALMGGDQATAPSRARQRAPKVSTAAAKPMEVEVEALKEKLFQVENEMNLVTMEAAHTEPVYGPVSESSHDGGGSD